MAAVGGVAVAGQNSSPSTDAASPTASAQLPVDQQFNALRSDAAQLAERASREQERISLEEARRKAEAERKRAAEAERKRLEALRPKYVLPINGDYRITARFGEVSGLWSKSHTGLDFAISSGTPVHAVTDGTIVFAGWDQFYGRYIRVRHKDGSESWYCHLSAFVRMRGTVQAGDVIGRVGSTGNSTGPHLHLEIRIDDEPINPATWLREHGLNP